MLAFSAALIRRLLPHLSEDVPRLDGLRTWMENGSFYLGFGRTSDEILLQDVGLTELIPFISHDYERFALSSRESLVFCTPEATRPKAVGWPAAQLYYSAFFAAHAIMRATGQAVFRVEKSQAIRMSQIASLYVPNLKIAAGTYCSRLIQRPGLSVDMSLVELPEGGGAHDQFWKSFYIFIGELTAEVSARNEPEATTVLGETSELQSILSANGFKGGTWLSSIRNQIMYQHKYGVWFPFQKSESEAVEYMRRPEIRDSSSIRRDHNTSKDPLLAFFACCHLIAAINRDLAKALCQRGKTQRFKQLWRRLESGAEAA